MVNVLTGAPLDGSEIVTRDSVPSSGLQVSAPHPDKGWSREVVTLRGATVHPPTSARYHQQAGVLAFDGTYVEMAAHWRFQRPMTVAPRQTQRPAPKLHGRWLWGGLLFSHFGHFLAESLCRLWAVDQVRRSFDGIIFIGKSKQPNNGLLPFQQKILDLLQIDLPIRLVTEPTRVDRLVVPGQGLGIGEIAQGTPETRAMIARRFARDIPAEGSKRIFIARTGLGERGSMLLGETMLEAGLIEAGYDVLHPQDHSLEHQIARMKAADDIIITDGSAAHLLALVANPSQRIAYVLRRRHWTEAPIAQITRFSGRAPVTVDALSRSWLPREPRRHRHLVFGELDLRQTQAILVGAGLIPSRDNWPVLTEAMVLDAFVRMGLADEFHPGDVC
jgi:capsular polysaccharide biosynthesis protein